MGRGETGRGRGGGKSKSKVGGEDDTKKKSKHDTGVNQSGAREQGFISTRNMA